MQFDVESVEKGHFTLFSVELFYQSLLYLFVLAPIKLHAYD